MYLIWGPLSLSLRILCFCIETTCLDWESWAWGESEKKEDKDYGGAFWNWDQLHMKNKTRSCGNENMWKKQIR